MLTILSPAKIQDFTTPLPSVTHTLPVCLDEAAVLMDELRRVPPDELPAVLNAGRAIAVSASDKYYNWTREHRLDNARQAIFVYNGEVFHGLDVRTFGPADLLYAQEHLCVLSALYGVLRPFDLIQPYRLEMQMKLHNPAGTTLYAFWKKKITSLLAHALEHSGEPRVLLNLASAEYAKAVDLKALGVRVLQADFLENKGGSYRNVTIYTKRARGLMARYVLQNRVENPDDLKGFDAEGYWYNTSLSDSDRLVFTRG